MFIARKLFAVFAVLFLSGCDSSFAGKHHAMQERLDKTKNRHLQGLELIPSNRSDKEGILAFYKRMHIFFPAKHKERPRQVLEDFSAVRLIVVSKEERRENKSYEDLMWTYSYQERMLYVPEGIEYTEVWNGAALAHAISHAMRDSVRDLRRIQPKERTEAEIRQEEIDAYRLEHDVLDGYTKGSYIKAVNEFLDNANGLPDAPRTWYVSVDESLASHTDKLFPPPVGSDEAEIRRRSLLVAMNLGLAKKLNINDEKLTDVDSSLTFPSR